MATLNVTLPADAVSLVAPQLLGMFFNWGLYGALSLQVYLFHIAFPKDRWIAKTIVYGIFVLETTQTILVTRDAYIYFAEGFGNVDGLHRSLLEWFATPTISGIVSCTVQLYYAYRLWILSRSPWLSCLICAIALMQGSAAIAEGVKFFIIGDLFELASKAFIPCTIWLAGSAACDIVIAGSLTFLLLRRRAKIPETQAIVTKLVHLIVETGMLTAAAATVDLVLFLVFPNNAYHTAIAVALAKLYSNSMLVILNSRMKIVGGRKMASHDSNSCIELGTRGRSAIRFAPPADTSSFATRLHIQEAWDDRDNLSNKEQVLSENVAARVKVQPFTELTTQI